MSSDWLDCNFKGCSHILNSHITKRTHSHITRGDWSPKIFKITYYSLVLSYSTLRVRSFKFETIGYVTKLKNFWPTSGLWIIKNLTHFFWYNHRMRLWILGGGHLGHFWPSRLSSVLKRILEAHGTGVPLRNVTVNLTVGPGWLGPRFSNFSYFWSRDSQEFHTILG